jgi:hypothetical protein
MALTNHVNYQQKKKIIKKIKTRSKYVKVALTALVTVKNILINIAKSFIKYRL